MERPDQVSSPPAGRMPEPLGPPTDPAQQSLVRALRSSFAILRLIMIVLVVLYLASGVFRIQPGEQGVIVRLGEPVVNTDEKSKFVGKPVFDRGWIWWALPDPFDEKIRLSGNIRRLQIDTFLFQRLPDDIRNKTELASIRPMSDKLRPGVDGAMLTGDKNLSHGLWEVEYRIVDAGQFVTGVSEDSKRFEPLLQRLFETSILREVAHYKVEQVTRTMIDILSEGVARRLQGELDKLNVGVEVVKVNSNTIVPPQVAPAFAEVTRAENEKKQQEDAAQQKANEILNQAAGPQHRELLEKIRQYGAAQLAGADPGRAAQLRAEIDAALESAQGEVAARLRDAHAYADTVRLQISREYEEFTYWLQQYREHPGATLISLWSAMYAEVLGSKENEIFWVPSSDVIEVIVNRDPNRAIEREQERLKKQMEQGR